MSRETRIQRPFEESDDFQRALDLAVFEMGAQRCDGGERIVIQAAGDFLHSEPQITWAADDEGMEEFLGLLRSGATQSKIAATDLGLVVVASSRYLRIADICLQVPLDKCDGLARTASFAECRPRALRASTSGATVTAYIVLLQEQERSDLKPWRRGTWLARTVFQVALTKTEDSIFQPTPLDDDARKQYGLPANTVRYFHNDDADPFTADGGQPQLFVDQDLLARLHSEAGSARSKALQAQLVCDFVNGIVREAAARARESEDGWMWSDVEDSLIGRVIHLAMGGRASTDQYEDALQLVRTDPGKLMALVEHAVGLQKTFAKWEADES